MMMMTTMMMEKKLFLSINCICKKEGKFPSFFCINAAYTNICSKKKFYEKNIFKNVLFFILFSILILSAKDSWYEYLNYRADMSDKLVRIFNYKDGYI